MIEHVIKIRSSICSQLMKSTLLKGTLLAGLGIFVITLAAIFLSPEYLTTYGLPLFAIGCGMITFGLLPYRRLTLLEKCPNEIWYKEALPTVSTKRDIVSNANMQNQCAECEGKGEERSRAKKIPVSDQNTEAACSQKLTYYCRNQEIFSTSVDIIHSFSYVESPSKYGILINLSNPTPDKVAIYDKAFRLSYSQETEPKSGKATLFLPYFSKRAYYQLLELIDSQ